jgi:hypothetical protein
MNRKDPHVTNPLINPCNMPSIELFYQYNIFVLLSRLELITLTMKFHEIKNLYIFFNILIYI